MFPSLPSDPPVPETLALVVLIGLALCACIFFVRKTQKRDVRLITQFVVFGLVILAAVICTIGARNIGRWGDLKRELVAYSITVKDYEAVHGVIDSAAKEDEFSRQHSRMFSFGRGGPEVQLTYLWRLDSPRVGIVWGSGGTAAFHLPTMVCVYSD